MNERLSLPDFGPDGAEASEGAAQTLGDIIRDKVANEGMYFDEVKGGSGSWDIDPEQVDNFYLLYRPPDSQEAPPILDELTKQELPGAIALYLRFQEKWRHTNTPLALSTSVEQVWLGQHEGRWFVRRRIFVVETPNFRALDRLSREEYHLAMERIEQRRTEQRGRQKRHDEEEDKLGLNRMTNLDVRQLIDPISRYRNPLGEISEE